jgi:hypothetical protein
MLRDGALPRASLPHRPAHTDASPCCADQLLRIVAVTCLPAERARRGSLRTRGSSRHQICAPPRWRRHHSAGAAHGGAGCGGDAVERSRPRSPPPLPPPQPQPSAALREMGSSCSSLWRTVCAALSRSQSRVSVQHVSDDEPAHRVRAHGRERAARRFSSTRATPSRCMCARGNRQGHVCVRNGLCAQPPQHQRARASAVLLRGCEAALVGAAALAQQAALGTAYHHHACAPQGP